MTELSTNHLDGNFGVTFKIKTALNEVRHAFVYIGFLLDEADRLEYYREKGYESIYEYCEIELGFKKSSTNNFIRIYQHFGEAMGLQSKYQAYSYSQLTEMCSMNDRLLRLCSPEMTVRELREIKRPSSGSRDQIFQTSGKEDMIPIALNNLWVDLPCDIVNQLLDFCPSHPKIRKGCRAYDIEIRVHKSE